MLGVSFAAEVATRLARQCFWSEGRGSLREHVQARNGPPLGEAAGDKDWSTPAEREEVAKPVKSSRVISLASTGHFSSMERPEAIARIILDENAGAVAA